MNLKQSITKLRNKPLIIIFSILAIVGILLIIQSTKQPYITITTLYPENNSQNITLVSPIQIIFSQPLPEKETLFINSNPAINGSINFDQSRTQAIFTPNNLYSPNTTYIFTISSKSVITHQSQFTTLTPKSLSQIIDTNNPDLTPQTSKGLTQLITSTPYKGKNHTLKYVIATDRFLIYPNYNTTDTLAEQEALEYIKSFGFTDPYKQLKISLYSNSFTPVGQPTTTPTNND